MQAPFDAVTACVPAARGEAEDEGGTDAEADDPASLVVAAPLGEPCVAKLVGPVAAPVLPVDDEEVQAPVTDAVVKTVRNSAAVRPAAVIRFISRSSALSPGGSRV